MANRYHTNKMEHERFFSFCAQFCHRRNLEMEKLCSIPCFILSFISLLSFMPLRWYHWYFNWLCDMIIFWALSVVPSFPQKATAFYWKMLQFVILKCWYYCLVANLLFVPVNRKSIFPFLTFLVKKTKKETYARRLLVWSLWGTA